MARAETDLDLRPLTAGSGLGARLRAVWSNNLFVLGAVIATILVLVPSTVFVSLLVTDQLTDGGAVALMVMLVGAGVLTWGSLLRQAGAGSAMARFAQVNSLDLVEARMSTDYAARVFASGTHLVHRAVRTPGTAYVEVGERFPAGDPSSTEPEPMLYLRVRLAEPVAWHVGPDDMVDDALASRLAALAAPYDVEVSGREITVLGQEPLGVTTEGRVAEAFALARALERRAAALAATAAEDPVPTPSGVWVSPERPPRHGRRLHPLVMVGGLVALLVVVPLAVAAVISLLVPEPTGSRFVATLVVVPVVWLVVAVVRGAIRLMLRPR